MAKKMGRPKKAENMTPQEIQQMNVQKACEGLLPIQAMTIAKTIRRASDLIEAAEIDVTLVTAYELQKLKEEIEALRYWFRVL